ncbi:hypothetical protein FNF29_07575 [Cafeteria roenbergensis]|uniref:Uncharacterized protein n=1 Tax=Cafeteria roenbergensis TaxID=33653 RepID=A0A5A8C1T0_CAFRO|nr:hypothetical protein FNF29_08286 [Cafeteria roenbergensis]KAA0147085.1 hypothetical protein FNF29_07575 [Cafeteria roenbergensis]|eukprot:KAA0146050.1 hypothetical protein FNF29_08286 [Cafeteria roenbergensis]
MLFARINVMQRAVGSGARAAGTLRTAARAAGAVIPGALVRSSGVSGFHVEDDAIMNEQDALGLQVGFMTALDVLTLTTRLLRTTVRYKQLAIPAAAPSGPAALCYGQTSGVRFFSSQAGEEERLADQKAGSRPAPPSASQPADVAGGLAAASSTLAAMLCTINCTVVPALAAVLPALSGAASASSAAASGDAACSSCEATLPFLGVSTAALKTFTFVGVAPLGLYAVASAYKSHKSPAVASVGLAGVASILALNVPSSVFPGAAAAVTAAVEAAPLVTESTAGLGGALLMIAHLLLTRRLAATQAQARASCCAASKPSCCSGPKETKA